MSRARRRCSGVAVTAATPSGSTKGRSNSPSSNFAVSTRRDGDVDGRLGDSSRTDGLEQRRAEAVGARQLDVEPGVEGHRRGFLGVGGEVVVVGELADREVVGHDAPVESPLLAQHAGQQLAVGGSRNAVELVVGVHHRAQPGGSHRRLERVQVDLAQLAGTEVRRAPS